MRLIHKNDFCRDIAIWYDEFLTPGENFNEAIREALEKSVYKKMNSVADELYEKTGTRIAHRYLLVSYGNISNICESQGKLQDALEYYRKALAIREQLAEETRTIKNYDDVAASYYNISVMETGAARWKPVNDAFEIWTALSRQCPDNSEFARRRDIVAAKLNKT